MEFGATRRCLSMVGTWWSPARSSNLKETGGIAINETLIIGIVLGSILGYIIAALIYAAALKKDYQRKLEHARKDIKERSVRTRVGESFTQLAPLLDDFPYEKDDARLISGGPIDYIIFSGLSQGRIDDIVFLEVKSGKARLNFAQKLVRDYLAEERLIPLRVYKKRRAKDA